jgi:hypothetical protein
MITYCKLAVVRTGVVVQVVTVQMTVLAEVAGVLLINRAAGTEGVHVQLAEQGNNSLLQAIELMTHTALQCRRLAQYCDVVGR